MTPLSVYTRAQQGDLSLLHEIDRFSYDDQKRCFTLAAQFGQTQLVKQWIAQYDTRDFAEHALWVAAHDTQIACVDLLASLVLPDNAVWESVLRYAIKNNWVSLQGTILAFEPLVGVDKCLGTAVQSNNKPLMETLLQRSTYITSNIVVAMMDHGWNDLVEQWISHLPSEEKNKLFVHCIEHKLEQHEEFFDVCKHDLKIPNPNALAAAIAQKNWTLAEQLLPYCDVPAAVHIVNKKRPDEETRIHLQRLLLMNEVGDVSKNAAKRKM